MGQRKNLLINSDVCTGCRLCELICSLVKEKESNPAKSRILNEFYLLEGMRVPRVCINCNDAPCIPSCPTDALVKDVSTGWVNLDNDKCNLCLACIDACPYGAIRLTPDNELIKCDLCQGDPECVKICEPQAIMYGDRQPQKTTHARNSVQIWSEVKTTERLVH
ncbi:4Fe-4S dicluster domain-containing protein [Chloroflexota bacterium]